MQERLQSSDREPTGTTRSIFIDEVGRTHGDRSLNAWMQPYQTNAAKALFYRSADERKAEAVERMGRIGDLHPVSGKCS